MLLKRYLSAPNKGFTRVNLVEVAASGNLRTKKFELVTPERFPENYAPGSVVEVEVELRVERFPALDLYRCTIARWVGARFYVNTDGSWQVAI